MTGKFAIFQHSVFKMDSGKRSRLGHFSDFLHSDSNVLCGQSTKQPFWVDVKNQESSTDKSLGFNISGKTLKTENLKMDKDCFRKKNKISKKYYFTKL